MKAKKGQNVIDLTLQLCGSVDDVFELILSNPAVFPSVDYAPNPGVDIVAPSSVSRSDIVAYYDSLFIQPGTGNDPAAPSVPVVIDPVPEPCSCDLVQVPFNGVGVVSVTHNRGEEQLVSVVVNDPSQGETLDVTLACNIVQTPNNITCSFGEVVATGILTYGFSTA